jgi:OmpA-OmpF porin, OOP family
MTELNRMASFLKKNPKVAVEVSGYADSRGSDVYNRKLSEERAQAVVEYLVSQGIDRQRMKATGNGVSDETLTANVSDKTGRQSDRRVELKIVKVR